MEGRSAVIKANLAERMKKSITEIKGTSGNQLQKNHRH